MSSYIYNDNYDNDSAHNNNDDDFVVSKYIKVYMNTDTYNNIYGSYGGPY
jgi:hypothetical protein